jgi:hypothetical protein
LPEWNSREQIPGCFVLWNFTAILNVYIHKDISFLCLNAAFSQPGKVVQVSMKGFGGSCEKESHHNFRDRNPGSFSFSL